MQYLFYLINPKTLNNFLRFIPEQRARFQLAPSFGLKFNITLKN